MFPELFYGEKRVFERSFHGGVSTLKMTNVSQRLQVSTVQVCMVFQRCVNGDKKSFLNGFEKNRLTVFQRRLRGEKKSCFAVKKLFRR